MKKKKSTLNFAMITSFYLFMQMIKQEVTYKMHNGNKIKYNQKLLEIINLAQLNDSWE